MAILIKNASQLLTMPGEGVRVGQAMRDLGIIERGCMLIEDGYILEVGSIEKIEREHPVLSEHAEEIDASGCVVMPGLIDCHTHLVHGGTRENEFNMRLNGASYMDIMNAGGGIYATTKRTAEATFDELYYKAYRHLNDALLYGVTTMEVKSGYGLQWPVEEKQLRVARKLNKTHKISIVSTFMGAHAIPLDYQGQEDAFVDIIIDEMLPQVDDLATFNDVFCEHGVYTPEQARRILEAGKQYGLIPKIHADEIEPYEGAELAAKVGAISAEHLLVASDRGIEQMAKQGVVAVLLPGTAFFLQAPYARARYMIDSGVPVALATDFNPGSSPTINLQFMMNLACMHMGMTLEEVLIATTANAACAIGRENITGALHAGKKADVVIMDVPNYKQLQYYYGVNHVKTVLKNGEVVVNNKQLVH